MPVVLAIASALCYGSADFVGGFATKKSPVFSVVVFSQLAGTVVVLAAAFLIPAEIVAVRDILWGAAAGIGGALGLVAFYHALATTSITVASPMAAVFGAFFPVLFGLITGERLGLTAWLGVGLAVPAILFLTMGKKAGEDKVRTKRAAILGALAGLGFGLFFITLSRSGSGSGLWPLLAARAASISSVAAFAFITRRGLPLSRASILPALAAGMLDMTANITYLFAVRGSLFIITTIIVGLYPAPTVLLAGIVLKEKLGMLKLLGLACAVAGIALMGL